jgi:hypothetical protein
MYHLSFLRSAARPSIIFVRRIDQCNQLLERPDVIPDVRLQRRRHSQRLVPGDEVVDEEVQRYPPVIRPAPRGPRNPKPSAIFGSGFRSC